MKPRILFSILFMGLGILAVGEAASPLKVLIVDGQNNHDWKVTTPLMKGFLEKGTLARVDVETSPPSGRDLKNFRPQFSAYDAVLSNYNGDPWPTTTQEALVNYVKRGGGLVIVHAANNAFGKWSQYNQMIGLGGWGGRNERSGPFVYFQDGKAVQDTSAGRGGRHGTKHAYQIVVRDRNHPITQGMPRVWMHAKDELYDTLRGPARDMTILATAYSDPTTDGSGRHEPMIFTIKYGQGRVFHTPMGHADYSMKCVGFVTTLRRGTQWAATGKVTEPIPKNFPGPDTVSVPEFQ